MAAPTARKTPAGQNTRQQLDELDALLQKMLALPVNPLDAGADEEPEPEPEPVIEERRAESTVLPRRISLRPVPQPPQTPEPAQDPAPALSPRLVQPNAAIPVREVNPTPEEEPTSEDWVPLRGDWQPSAQTWGPLAEIFKQQDAPERETPDEPGVIRETIAIPMPTQSPTPRQEAASLPYLPTPVVTPRQEPAAEVPLSSVEAMARLEAARRATPATPAAQERAREAATEPTVSAEEPEKVAWPIRALNKFYDVLTYPLGPVGGWLRGPGGRGALAFLGGIFLAAGGILLALDWFDWTW
jgi:hypothetical protein